MEPEIMLTIQQLSKEVGIGVDTLRIWERRYNFPCPQRDRRGHRQYPEEQVEQLRIVKGLQQAGQRPKNIFALAPAARRELLESQCHQHSSAVSLALHYAAHSSLEQLQRYMDKCFQEMLDDDKGGIDRFISELALPMVQALNDGVSDGCVTIAREHMVSDLLSAKLQSYLQDNNCAASGELRCLCVTINGERHKLGLLMAACLLKLAGVHCVWIQEDLPLSEVPGIASELGCSIVAISFSSHYPQRRAMTDLATLRRLLPEDKTIVAGGAALDNAASMPQFFVRSSLKDIGRTVAHLQSRFIA